MAVVGGTAHQIDCGSLGSYAEPPFLKRWLDPSTRGGRAPEMSKTFSFLKLKSGDISGPSRFGL